MTPSQFAATVAGHLLAQGIEPGPLMRDDQLRAIVVGGSVEIGDHRYGASRWITDELLSSGALYRPGDTEWERQAIRAVLPEEAPKEDCPLVLPLDRLAAMVAFELAAGIHSLPRYGLVSD